MNKQISTIVVLAIFALTSCAEISQFRFEPPKEVLEDKTPEQYYRMGRNYKDAGWPEQARECLTRAIKADENGEVGKKAKIYLKAYLPREPISQTAISRNITAFNQAASGSEDEAIAGYQACIKDYPTFEWPYGNLAALYTKAGRYKDAQATVQKALTLNPNYLNGWLHLARALAADRDRAGAIRCTKRALEIDPDSTAATELMKSLMHHHTDRQLQ